MNEVYDLIIIGAGASGIMCAVRAAERHRKVLLLEKAERPGRKILASGNGRCNLMNLGPRKYYGDSEFAEAVYRQCSPRYIYDYFTHLGLLMTEEEEGRVYPFSYQAATVMNVLKDAMDVFGVTVKTGICVSKIQHEENCFIVHSDKKIQYQGTKLMIACGGAAQPKLGGNEDGYLLLHSMGHMITKLKPSLVPLKTDSKSISGLSGIRCRAAVSLQRNNKLIHQEKGEILFTDYGISGICIMQCARFITDKDSYLEIDFLNSCFKNDEDIFREFIRRRKLFQHMSPICLLEGILSSRIAYAVLKQAGIPMRGEKAGELTDDDLRRIISSATHYRIMITGTRGFEYAQVTAGGASCAEFDPSTMESKIIPGLFAAGEVLNVDGDCGGYNLMFAFTTGYLAGNII